MPSRFEFEQQQRDGLRLIRWLGDLEIDGWERDDLWGSSTPRFVGEYGMYHGAGLLDPALLGLVWRLTAGRARFVLPEFDGVSVCERLGRRHDLVGWEYGVEWEQPDWHVRDRGFVVAESQRTLLGSQRGGQARFERVEGAALAATSTWEELMSVIPVGDQANTLCVFAIRPDGGAHVRLLSVLRADQPPVLDTVLTTEDDVFAVITQEDEGLGLSSLLIARRGHFRDSFRGEAEQLVNRLDTYLVAAAAAAHTLEEWSAAVDRLANLSRTVD